LITSTLLGPLVRIHHNWSKLQSGTWGLCLCKPRKSDSSVDKTQSNLCILCTKRTVAAYIAAVVASVAAVSATAAVTAASPVAVSVAVAAVAVASAAVTAVVTAAAAALTTVSASAVAVQLLPLQIYKYCIKKRIRKCLSHCNPFT